MEEFDSIDEILEFARDREGEAKEFYKDLVVREAEKKAGAEEPTGLRLADYGLDDKPQLDLEYEDLLVWAMKKEKASFRLYVDLAAVVRDVEFRETLLSLAEEEAKHKVQLEIEYDEFVAKRK
jgi:rubrerythrin